MRCLEPQKAEPQEMFGGSNTDPHKVFGCLGKGYNKSMKSIEFVATFGPQKPMEKL